MSFEPFHRLRDGTRRFGILKDLDDAVLSVDARSDHGAVVIPAGTDGTIVAVWRDGAACDVEFAEPEGALCKVRPDQIRVVGHCEA